MHQSRMRAVLESITLGLLLTSWVGVSHSQALISSADQIQLGSAESRQQLVISVSNGDELIDVTRDARLQLQDSGIVEIDRFGFVHPLKNGETELAVKWKSATPLTIPVRVSGLEVERAVSFPNDVMPQLTRAGCNGGSCHGTPKGQNNFRLSLLGYEPRSDHGYLTRESRGRRIVPSAPDLSLLMRKASGNEPHRGGAPLPPDSDGYRILFNWIRSGMPYGPSDDPTVDFITVYPSKRLIQRDRVQQLVVTANFSDGSKRDITRIAQYQSNQADMCEADQQGLVKIGNRTGTASVMVRFQEHVATFTATIPLGVPTSLPPSNNLVDRFVYAKLESLGLPPSEICGDATFLRRVHLDLTGRLPTPETTKRFLASTEPAKRNLLIESLLQSDGYADLFANKWSGILRNKAGGNLEQIARETYGFHNWIRENLHNNLPFDQFAKQLITAKGKPSTNPAVSWYRAVSDPNERVADIAQVFLGVRIQCAQCHHHPYEKWTQDDYHAMSAFFSTLDRKEVRKLPEDDILYHKRIPAIATNPNTGVQLKPTPLDGQALEIPPSRDPRVDLAEWMTEGANPFFAKVLVNRYWKHFFGRGLVEPEDDLRITNPATHPELLDALAKYFVDSGFDLRELCRLLAGSQSYQQSSFPNQHNRDDEQNFARYYPRRLGAEIMLDAINDIAGSKNSFNRQPIGIRAVALPDDSANRESFFLRAFGRPQMDTACECERSGSADLSQSLTLLNSDTMHRILNTPNGTPSRLAADETRDDSEKIASIYLHALCREPSAHELHTGLHHLEKKRRQSSLDPKALPPAQAEREAYEDIVWVVVNTKEFLFNH